MDLLSTNNQEEVPPKRSKKDIKVKLDEHVQSMKPFKLNDLFKWIFDKQIEVMRPFVKDYNIFVEFTNILWEQYMEASGAKFDITQKSLIEIRNRKYPLGWGVSLNPNRVEETLSIVPRKYHKLKKEQLEKEIECDCYNDSYSIKKCKCFTSKDDAKNVKIEKMVIEKFTETKKKRKRGIRDDKKDSVEPGANNIKKKSSIKTASMPIDVDAHSLSDKHGDGLLHLYDLNDKEFNVARVLKDKKESELRYIGGRVKTEQLYMENNLLLLYYGLSLSMQGTRECCCLLDIWRLAKRGVLPFLKVTRILPVDMFFLQHTVFQSMVLRDVMPSFSDMKHYAYYLAETLDLQMLLKPDLDVLVERTLENVNLPSGVSDLVRYLREKVDEKLDNYYGIRAPSRVINVDTEWRRFKAHGQHILVPELSCLGYIFLAMRIMMRFDGEYEQDASELSVEFNVSDVRDRGEVALFVWRDWLRQQYRPRTVHTAKTWADLGRVVSAKMFFEDDVDGENEEDEGADNALVNVCGRFVQPYRMGSHDSVIKGLMEPLDNAVKRGVTSQLHTHTFTEEVDYRNSRIDHLLDPSTFREELKKNCSTGHPSKHNSIDWQVIDKLVALAQKKPLKLTALANEEKRYPRGVFEELLAKNRMTRDENRLLELLVRDSGIAIDVLCDTTNSLVKILAKSSTKDPSKKLDKNNFKKPNNLKKNLKCKDN